MKKVLRASWILSIVLLLFMRGNLVAHAQGNTGGVDLMVVIDNSLSMFREGRASDPDFLRISSAGIFISRLGLGEENPAAFQMGTISFAEDATLVSPLQPFLNQAARDSRYAAISNPRSGNATNIRGALEAAYAELQSERHRPGNNPAIVLLTDGRPEGVGGQSNAELEKLAADHPDIPVYIILLHNPTFEQQNSADAQAYRDYIQFWYELQKYPFVHTYEARTREELADLYNKIITQITGGQANPLPGLPLSRNKPVDVTVNEYAEKLTVLALWPDADKGQLQIVDARGGLVLEGQPGVNHSRGQQNPAEAYTIGKERIADKYGIWRISTDRDATIRVFIDVASSFGIEFVSPEASKTGSTENVWQASASYSASKPLQLALRIVDKEGKPISDPVKVSAEVGNKDQPLIGTLGEKDFIFDSQSQTYTANYTFQDPNLRTQSAIYIFNVRAQLANLDTVSTSAQLRVQVGPRPYILDVKITGTNNTIVQPDSLATITIADYDGAGFGALQVEVVDSLGGNVSLSDQGPSPTDPQMGIFMGSLASLLNKAGDHQLTVKLSGRALDGLSVQDSYPIQQVFSLVGPTTTPLPTVTPVPSETPLPPTKTPTPLPTPTRTPTPKPTTVPLAQIGGVAIHPEDLLFWILGFALFVLILVTAPFWVNFLLTRIADARKQLPDGFFVVYSIDSTRGTQRKYIDRTPVSARSICLDRNRRRVWIGTKGEYQIPDDADNKELQRICVIFHSNGVTYLGQNPNDQNKAFSNFVQTQQYGKYYVQFSLKEFKT